MQKIPGMARFYEKEVHPQDNVSLHPRIQSQSLSKLTSYAAFLSAESHFQMDLYQRLCNAWS